MCFAVIAGNHASWSISQAISINITSGTSIFVSISNVFQAPGKYKPKALHIEQSHNYITTNAGLVISVNVFMNATIQRQ